VPLSIRLVLGAVELLAGLGLLTVALLGARGRLRRNRWAGVRTTASLRGDDAFALANRVAAVPLGAAAAVAVVAGAVLLAGADGAPAWVVFGIGVLGTLALVGVGGSAGDRAAAALPEPVRPGCAGECAGCELVATCRPAPEAAQDASRQAR
jgi:SdpI/YfhL protein family